MPRLATRVLASLVAVSALAGAVHADTDYFTGTPDPRSVTVLAVPPRTGTQRLLIGGLALGAAAMIGVGVAFNLDSRSAADEVSATRFTNRVWTQEAQDTYDRAGRSGLIAGLFYGAGGLLLVGTMVAYWRTSPTPREVQLRPGSPAPTAILAPTRGGAIVGAGWSF